VQGAFDAGHDKPADEHSQQTIRNKETRNTPPPRPPYRRPARADAFTVDPFSLAVALYHPVMSYHPLTRSIGHIILGLLIKLTKAMRALSTWVLRQAYARRLSFQRRFIEDALPRPGSI